MAKGNDSSAALFGHGCVANELERVTEALLGVKQD